MKLTKAQAKQLETAIGEWEKNSLITPDTASKLRESFQVIGFDWKRLAKYSFWISVICVAIAVTASIADKLIEPILLTVFGSVYRGYCVIFAIFATALFTLVFTESALSQKKCIATKPYLYLGFYQLQPRLHFSVLI